MASSLNSYLTGLASNYFISHGSTERDQITTSFGTIQTRLKNHFGNKVNDVLVFGSWDRDTILPRKYDTNSDLDIMIVFDHSTLNNTPETYRKWVLEFAQSKYSTSLSKKDFPTVRLDMTHITFDLVPTRIEEYVFWKQHYIPNSGNQWMTTDPFSFTQTVKQKNVENKSVVKPVLRLVKAWNAKAGYPFDSYDLEKYIVNNVFWSWNQSVESAFFSAINCLPTLSGTQVQINKVVSAQSNIKTIKTYLDNSDVTMAKLWLHILLP